MLLNDLTIENFRSFEKYKLDKLARVNLLVGDNNCGKTSVLEALRLLVARDKIGTILHMLELREDFDHVSVGTGTPETYEVRFDGSSLFHQGMIAESFDDFRTIKLSANAKKKLQMVVQVQQSSNQPTAEMVTRSSPGSEEERGESITMHARGLLARPWERWPIEWKSMNNDVRGAYFLSAFNRSTEQLAAMWEKVIEDKRESHVLSALQVINEAYLGVIFSPRTETLRDIHIDIGSERISMSLLGNGIELMLRAGIALASSKSSFLLIDEIDTGLHYSRLADMWKMVITAAKNLDVQVFATTHSLDCIRGLSEAVRNDESFTEEVAVFRIDRRTDHAIRFGGEELEIIVENEIEVR